MDNFFLLMQQELLITAIIFILLFMKLSTKEWNPKQVLTIVNGLLFVNLAAGFFMREDGTLFGDMFQTNALLRLEKNILSLGTLVISLQSYNWLLKHKHALEFYLLMLSTLLGMFFMLSSSNLLMFYVGLELASIPLAALANFDLDKKRSSEAAMKYIMSSAFASGLLLLVRLASPKYLPQHPITRCSFLPSSSLFPALVLKYHLYHFIYGQPTYTKVHRWPLRLTSLLFQKAVCCL
jgi:NADH-quinone oxidoreductase subunit N